MLREINQPAERPLNVLTEREQETLRLIAEGLSNQAIAAQMGIHETTVAKYVSALLGKRASPAGPRRRCMPSAVGWLSRSRNRKRITPQIYFFSCAAGLTWFKALTTKDTKGIKKSCQVGKKQKNLIFLRVPSW